MYQPPPLTEVWLDETEHREKKKQLCKQHGYGVEKMKAVERNIVDRVPEGAKSQPSTRNSDPLPNLVKSDDSRDGSSGDSSTLEVSHESEGKMRADHPNIIYSTGIFKS